MSKFVTRKIISIARGVFFSSAIVVGSFTAMYFGKSLLSENFSLGALLISLAPLSIFLTAFYYQGSVVFSIRQIAVEPEEDMTKFEKRFVRTAESSYIFAKWIPLIITAFAAILSVTFIPGSIGHAAFESGRMIEMTLASLLISANFILFVKMANQITHSKNSVSYP